MPVGDVPVEVTLEGGSRKLRSNAAGEIEFDRGSASWIELEGEIWRRAKRRGSGLNGTGILWIYRDLRVECTLRTRDGEPFDPGDAGFRTFVDDAGLSPAGWDGPGAEYRARIVGDARIHAESTGDEGRFVVHVPRIRGIVLGVSAKGWRSATVALDPYMRSTVAHVELVLERGYRVRGRLIDDAGRPIVEGGVSAYTIVRISAEDLLHGPSPLHRAAGYGAAADLASGDGYMKFTTAARTDDRGRFELSIDVADGHTWLLAGGKGTRRAEYEVGAPASDVEDLVLVAETIRGNPVIRLDVNGQPLADTTILVCDLDFGATEAQPSFQRRTNADGELPADWLKRGRRYSFAVVLSMRLVRHGCVRWDGERSIDLARDLRPASELFPKR
jgi:hypothetical protein